MRTSNTLLLNCLQTN